MAGRLAEVQGLVARQARDVAVLAEAMEENRPFLIAWRDLLHAQQSANANQQQEHHAGMDVEGGSF